MTETRTPRRTGLTIAMLVSLLLTFASIWLWEVFSYPTLLFGGLTALFIKLGGGPDSIRGFFRWVVTRPRPTPPNARAKGKAAIMVAATLGISSIVGFLGTLIAAGLYGNELPWSLHPFPNIFRYSPTLLICVGLLIYGIGKITEPPEPMYSTRGQPPDRRFVVAMSIAVLTFTLGCILPLYYTFMAPLSAEVADERQWIYEIVIYLLALAALLRWMKWGSGDQRWRPIIYLITLMPVVNTALGTTLTLIYWT